MVETVKAVAGERPTEVRMARVSSGVRRSRWLMGAATVPWGHSVTYLGPQLNARVSTIKGHSGQASTMRDLTSGLWANL